MLCLSDNLQINLQNAAGQRLAVIGKSGSGKTHTLRVFTEEWIGAGLSCTIIDPMSQFRGLTHLPVITVGRDGGDDIAITAANAAGLARLSVEQRVSVVIDTSLYTEDETLEVLRVYLESMWSLLLAQKQPQPYALVIDEAHLFAPQQGSTVLSKIIVDIAKRGRHKQLTSVIATQRAASIEKNFLTQATLLIAHRLTFGVDTKVLSEQLPLKSKELNGMMRKLNTGEALVIGDSALVGDADYLQVQVRPLRSPTVADLLIPPFTTVDMTAVRRVLDELKAAQVDARESAEDSEIVKALKAAVTETRAELIRQNKELDGKDKIIADRDDQIRQLRKALADMRQKPALPGMVQPVAIVTADGIADGETGALRLLPKFADRTVNAAAQRQQKRVQAQQRKLLGLIDKLNDLDKYQRSVCGLLLDNPRRSYLGAQIDNALGYAEGATRNNPPHELMALGLIYRERVAGGFFSYRANLSGLEDQFPALVVDEVVEQILDAVVPVDERMTV